VDGNGDMGGEIGDRDRMPGSCVWRPGGWRSQRRWQEGISAYFYERSTNIIFSNCRLSFLLDCG
jgi:hypothetical protein